MHFDWVTFLLQTANFAVLVWLLQRFLYRPVLRMVDARRAEIDNGYERARAAEAKGREALAATEREQQDAAAARVALLKEAAAEAEKAAAARRAQAESEAAAIRAEAGKSLAAERAKALAETRNFALDLAAEIATRVVAELPAGLRAAAWIERIAQYFESLPATEAERLKRQLAAEGTALGVVTASALPEEAAEAWRSELRRFLAEGTEIVFSVEPGLIAGAELHFPSAILRFSFNSALAAMRAEVTGRGEPY